MVQFMSRQTHKAGNAENPVSSLITIIKSRETAKKSVWNSEQPNEYDQI